jgi:hypothetical protein
MNNILPRNQTILNILFFKLVTNHCFILSVIKVAHKSSQILSCDRLWRISGFMSSFSLETMKMCVWGIHLNALEGCRASVCSFWGFGGLGSQLWAKIYLPDMNILGVCLSEWTIVSVQSQPTLGSPAFQYISYNMYEWSVTIDLIVSRKSFLLTLLKLTLSELFTGALTEGLCTSRWTKGSRLKCHLKNKMWFPLKTRNSAFCVTLSLHNFMHRKFLKNSFSSCLPVRNTTVKLPDFMAFFSLPISCKDTFVCITAQ